MNSIYILGAYVLDLLIGDPSFIPHPIVYIGKNISFLEKHIRKLMPKHLKLGGFFLVLGVLMTTMLFVTALTWTISFSKIITALLMIYFLNTSLAARCLKEEAKKVMAQLEKGDLEGARTQIGYLVGRDTTQLSEGEIIRATVETVAENTVDGVLAPLFYMGLGLFFGLPLHFAFFYKAVNTMDSMVGYKNERFKDIGFAAAKLDDILNYLPARLGSLLMGFAGGLLGYPMKRGFRILKRDCRNHKSPNCGFPESVVAGLLGVQIGGTNVYFGEIVEKPTIGDRERDLEAKDITKTYQIMFVSELLLVLGIVAVSSLI